VKTTQTVTSLASALALGCALGMATPALAVPASTSLLYTSGVDANGYLDVQVYDTSKPQNGPIRTFHSSLTANATDMAVDQAGNLYVSQHDSDQPVVIFERGGTGASVTLLDPLADAEVNSDPVSPPGPGGIAVAADGTVYAEMCCALDNQNNPMQSGMLVYKKGATKPSAFLTYNYQPDGFTYSQCPFNAGVAVDAKGDVYVGCTGIPSGNRGYFGVGRVLEYPAGSTTPVDTGIRVAAEWPNCTVQCFVTAAHDPDFSGTILDVQTDSKGNLVVLAGAVGGNAIFVYPPNTPRPSQIIPLNAYSPPSAYEDQRSRIRFDATMTHIFVNLLGANGKAVNEIDEYTYPGGKHIATFSNGMLGADAFALSPAPAL
jgi:hypothetical protein